MTDPEIAASSAKHPSPPLVLLGIVFTVLFLAAVFFGRFLGGGGFPSPHAAGDRIESYFTTHADAVSVSAFFLFAAAVPLGLFAAVTVSRLQFLGIRAAGATIALFGGFMASAFLALSGLLEWVLSRPDVLTQPALIQALYGLIYMTGGVGHVVFLGLFLAGVSVTTGVARLLPRWVVVLGLVLAVLAELSTLVLVVPAVAVLVPVARFPALVWIIATGALLPRSPRRT